MTLLVAMMLLATGCTTSGSSATAKPGVSQGQFVLVPKWLPPGFSASGGGYVDPPGGLQLGDGASESVIVLYKGSKTSSLYKRLKTSSSRQVPVLFTLSYYGYHNPIAEIQLTAAPEGIPATGSISTLGGRKVHLSSWVDGSGFVPITDTSAVWEEHHVFVQAIGRVISEQQMARFVANLVERPRPRTPVLSRAPGK